MALNKVDWITARANLLSRPPRLLSLGTRLSCTAQTNDFLCHTHFSVPRHPLVCSEAPFFLLHPGSLVCLPCQIWTFPVQGLLQQKNITITSSLTLIQNTKQLLLRHEEYQQWWICPLPPFQKRPPRRDPLQQSATSLEAPFAWPHWTVQR